MKEPTVDREDQTMEPGDPPESYAADVHPVRSILDQVDDFLNEKHESQHDNSHWQSMQVDLDQLSHTLFENKNEQHQTQGHQQQLGQGHVRPDMVFSPMASPVVVPNQPGSVSANATPFLGTSTECTSTTNTPFLAASSGSGGGSGGGSGSGGIKTKRNNRYTPGQFSPLSSPALVALDQQQMLNFSLPESSLGKRTTSSTSLRTKRAPGSNISSKVVKNSPNLNARRRYSAEYFKNNNSRDELIFKLPEHAVPQRQAGAPDEEDAAPETVPPSPGSKMTPATLMNYPKVILPSNNRSEHSQSPDEKMESNTKIWRATESPVIKPRRNSSQARPTARATQLPPASESQSSSDQRQDAPRQDTRPKYRTSRSSSSINLTGGGISSGSPVEEDESSKREVHKVAEQGRRNRLNLALAELNTLLPSELKETVVIPSKATTVELACMYIRQLRREEPNR